MIPLKVLHIGKYFAPFRGGVETYLLDAMTALTRRGVTCAALVHDHRASLRGRETSRNVDGRAFVVSRAATWFRLAFTPISPGFRGRLRRLLDDFAPDIVHVHLPNPSAMWLLTLAQAGGRPLVVHWHSDVVTAAHGPLMKALYRLYRPLERRLLDRAAAIVATSESYLDSSESLRAWPEKCHVVPLGLDPARFAAIDSGAGGAGSGDGTGNEVLNVLAIGRLTYYKGFGYLIRAAARVEGVHVHIVGEGELKRELRGLARQLDAQGRVTFHGAMDDTGLAHMLSDCDCLCLPSIERTEAFGLVLLEAMYFGRATVASAVRGSGMDWIVQDGITGLKVPPRNVDALAGALRRLRDDRDLVSELGRGGRERFDDQFTIDRSVDALLEVYRGVLA